MGVYASCTAIFHGELLTERAIYMLVLDSGCAVALAAKYPQ